MQNPYFTLRYNGQLSTVTYNGGQTYVTHRAKRADFYYAGSDYGAIGPAPTGCDAWLNSLGGDPAPSLAKKIECTKADWALLIFPEDVWADIGVVPAYMGFSKSRIVDIENTGYPNCAEVSSPNVPSCTAQKMYGMSCTVKVNRTDRYYTNCDISSGHSGGPSFYTSGSSRYLIGNISNSDETLITSDGFTFLHPGTDDGCGVGSRNCLARDTGTTADTYNLQVNMRSSFNIVRF